jgi:hypothetical protein
MRPTLGDALLGGAQEDDRLVGSATIGAGPEYELAERGQSAGRG